MPARRFVLLLMGVLLGTTLLAFAQDSGPQPPDGLLASLQTRIASIRQSFEAWRRAPYERLEQNFSARQSALLREVTTLQGRLDLLRNDLETIELTPGPRGVVGPPGPVGPRGHQGLPGNLQLAGETCPAGQSVSGFDAFGNMLCSAATATVTVVSGVGRDCPGSLASAADLRRCDLRREQLGGRDLSFASLVKADMRTPLDGTDLQGADLRKANFTGTDLKDVDMSHANLTFARMGSVHIEQSDLSGSIMRQVELSLSQTVSVRLVGADLSDSLMVLSQHYGSDFTRANLSGVDMRQALFEDASLFLATTSTSLDQARMINTICPDGVNSSTNANSCAGHELRGAMR